MTGGMVGSSFLSRVMVFIDGHYLEKVIDDKKWTDKGSVGLIYQNIPNFLVSQTQRGSVKPELERAYYYNALPNLKDLDNIKDQKERDNIEKKMKEIIQKNEPRFDAIRLLDMFDVRLGRLVYSKNGEPRQKGVDSLIAIDMLSKAFKKDYNEAVLVAGDSDFVEVVKAVKDAGVKVAGAFFKENTSKELIQSFDKQIVLDSYDFVKNNLLDS